MQNTKSLKIKGDRDGENLTPYKNYKEWTYKRWAWEFLRRNENFQKACNAIGPNENEKRQQEIAEEFGLKKYKYYKDAYKKGKTAKFISTVSAWKNTSTSEYTGPKLPKTLKQGEVLLRVNLKIAINDNYFINALVNDSERLLKKYLKELLSTKTPTQKNRSRKKILMIGTKN